MKSSANAGLRPLRKDNPFSRRAVEERCWRAIKRGDITDAESRFDEARHRLLLLQTDDPRNNYSATRRMVSAAPRRDHGARGKEREPSRHEPNYPLGLVERLSLERVELRVFTERPGNEPRLSRRRKISTAVEPERRARIVARERTESCPAEIAVVTGRTPLGAHVTLPPPALDLPLFRADSKRAYTQFKWSRARKPRIFRTRLRGARNGRIQRFGGNVASTCNAC